MVGRMDMMTRMTHSSACKENESTKSLKWVENHWGGRWFEIEMIKHNRDYGYQIREEGGKKAGFQLPEMRRWRGKRRCWAMVVVGLGRCLGGGHQENWRKVRDGTRDFFIKKKSNGNQSIRIWHVTSSTCSGWQKVETVLRRLSLYFRLFRVNQLLRLF